MSAPLALDGLARLNRMVSGWQTQPQTITAVVRNVFPLVTNKQTYTIGLGGDFNVARPIGINGAALWLNAFGAAQGITSITRSGYAATVTQTAHPFAIGDWAFVDGANELLYNGLQTVNTAPDANTWTFTVQGTPISPATGTITAAPIVGTPVEIPQPVITDSAFQMTQLKNLANAQFTTIYYNPTGPLGTLFLWPRPNTNQNQLVLYLQTVFTGFADLDTEYAFPDLPGYAEALQYQLDLRLAVPYGRTVSPEIMALARESLGLIKRANNKLFDLPTDATGLTHDRRGGYNINTDQGG
jgi:hypothetical protein